MPSRRKGNLVMRWWNAFSTCWPPGQNGCVVWWDAWAAIGTLLAVAVALGLALIEHGRRRREAVGRSMWIAVALHLPVFQWAKEVERLRKMVGAAEIEGILDKVDPNDGGRSWLDAPAEITELRREIHELGDIGGAIAQASFLLNELRGKWNWIEEGLRGDYDGVEQERAAKLLADNVTAAGQLLGDASRRIESRLRRSEWIGVRGYVWVRRGKRLP